MHAADYNTLLLLGFGSARQVNHLAQSLDRIFHLLF